LKGGNQPIGVNMLAKIGYAAALFLGQTEEEAKKCTSHTWRRSGATILANCSASVEQIKVAGNWKSQAAAEGYIQKSGTMKRTIANFMESDDDKLPELLVDDDDKVETAQKAAKLTVNAANTVPTYQNVYHISGSLSIGSGFTFGMPPVFTAAGKENEAPAAENAPMKFIFPKNVVNKCK
jgi:hypothetical protein